MLPWIFETLKGITWALRRYNRSPPFTCSPKRGPSFFSDPFKTHTPAWRSNVLRIGGWKSQHRRRERPNIRGRCWTVVRAQVYSTMVIPVAAIEQANAIGSLKSNWVSGVNRAGSVIFLQRQGYLRGSCDMKRWYGNRDRRCVCNLYARFIVLGREIRRSREKIYT